MNFLRLKKEVARYRGELQNDSISGIGQDELTMIEDNINKEMRKIANLRPPFLRTEFHVKLRASVALQTSTTVPSVTGTKGVPVVNDSEKTLSKRHNFWNLSDGTHSYRNLPGNTGTTYNLDYGTFSTATTATLWTASKDVYPLPHNCGPIIDVWMEDGDIPLTEESGTAFLQFHKQFNYAAEPRVYSYEAFTNKWSFQKFSQASITATNGSNILDVGTTWVAYYDFGDNALLDTATTAEHLHTITGIDADLGLVYIDRDYTGTSGAVTVYCNPVQHTRYISFWQIPDTHKDIRIDAYMMPQDLVADTDECIFNEDICRAIIIGAVKEDSISRGFLTQQQLAWYEEALQEIKQSPSAHIEFRQRYVPLGGTRTFRESRITGR